MSTTIETKDRRDHIPQDAHRVEKAREILRRVFHGIELGLAVALEDGTPLYQNYEPLLATIVLRDPSVLRALLTRSSDLAAGEAAVRGDLAIHGDLEWALGVMDAVAAKRTPKEWIAIVSLTAQLPRESILETAPARRGPAKLRGRVHSPERDRAAIAYHYDVSNDFYALWLDRQMTYSCAYFRDESDTLEEAQQQKYDLICRKLRLRPGERLLDVGCGWGGLVRFAAREYGAYAVGVTLSERQAVYARLRIAAQELGDRCSIELLDYRELGDLGSFDKAASVGMVEHVGDAMLPTYFRSVFAALAPGGLFLNHGIVSYNVPATGSRGLAAKFLPSRSRFTEHYVFPDGQMPRLPQMIQAAQGAGFELRDVENLREHYTQTLRHWLQRLEASEEEARSIVGDETYNVWRFWLAGSARSFDTHHLEVVQMLLAKHLHDGRANVPPTRADIYK